MLTMRLKTLMLAALFTALLISSQSRATTIAQMDFYDVLATAELVFEGRVVHVESRLTGPRSIHTRVRFEILDVLKGEYRQPTLELQYLGGQVGTQVLEVQSMQIPGLGEHGFYFVESLQTPLVHPLVGWSQGHFLIESDDTRQQRLYTADEQPVADIVDTPAANAPAILGHDGSARGVVVQGLSAPAPAMTAGRFRQLVRDAQRAGNAPGVQP